MLRRTLPTSYRRSFSTTSYFDQPTTTTPSQRLKRAARFSVYASAFVILSRSVYDSAKQAYRGESVMKVEGAEVLSRPEVFVGNLLVTPGGWLGLLWVDMCVGTRKVVTTAKCRFEEPKKSQYPKDGVF